MEQKQVQQYRFIYGESPNDLELKVGEYLDKGWKLHGSTTVTIINEKEAYFNQPVIKE